MQLYDPVLERASWARTASRIMLSIAYGAVPVLRHAAASPEVCYRAGGFERGAAGVRRRWDRALPVTRLVARLPGRPEPITYWAVIGGQVDAGRSATLLERLAGCASAGAATACCVPVVDRAGPGGRRRHQSAFASAMLQALAPAARAPARRAGPP